MEGGGNGGGGKPECVLLGHRWGYKRGGGGINGEHITVILRYVIF